MSMSVEIDSELFGIGAKVTGGYEWSVEHTTDKGGSKSEAVTVSNTAGPMVLSPGQGKIFAEKGEAISLILLRSESCSRAVER